MLETLLILGDLFIFSCALVCVSATLWTIIIYPPAVGVFMFNNDIANVLLASALFLSAVSIPATACLMLLAFSL